MPLVDVCAGPSHAIVNQLPFVCMRICPAQPTSYVVADIIPPQSVYSLPMLWLLL